MMKKILNTKIEKGCVAFFDGRRNAQQVTFTDYTADVDEEHFEVLQNFLGAFQVIEEDPEEVPQEDVEETPSQSSEEAELEESQPEAEMETPPSDEDPPKRGRKKGVR